MDLILRSTQVLEMLLNRECRTVNFLGTELPEPRLLLDFLGFEKHVIQIRDKRGAQIWPGWYDHAAYYIADLPPEKVFGPGEEVVIPSCVKAPDYEFELACFVTKTALISNEQEAFKFFQENCYVSIMNDWSARDVQKKDIEGLGPSNSKSIMGKTFGPVLVKASDLPMDENGVMDLEMVLTINGQERGRSNYKTLYHTHPNGTKAAWSFPRIISWLGQQNISVHPGYVIGSGTVGNGCIAEFMAKVDPQTNQELTPARYPWLTDGDTVTMEVQHIGKLENKVRAQTGRPGLSNNEVAAIGARQD